MAMLPNGQLHFAHGLLWSVLLTLGMQTDPLFAKASDESKADTKDGLVVLIAVDQLWRNRLTGVAGFDCLHERSFGLGSLSLVRQRMT